MPTALGPGGARKQARIHVSGTETIRPETVQRLSVFQLLVREQRGPTRFRRKTEDRGWRQKTEQDGDQGEGRAGVQAGPR